MPTSCLAVTKPSANLVSTSQFSKLERYADLTLGYSDLPEKCPVCSHAPLEKDICSLDDFTRKNVSNFLKREKRKRDKATAPKTPAEPVQSSERHAEAIDQNTPTVATSEPAAESNATHSHLQDENVVTKDAEARQDDHSKPSDADSLQASAQNVQATVCEGVDSNKIHLLTILARKLRMINTMSKATIPRTRLRLRSKTRISQEKEK